ncbi:hypothetical protein AVEN_213727-1 [Araneus ventricosus]|uniref:Uncharacterized protein n=1 Tax=Araneus ventricosus TaxID=182803 RepID=A0A4Y2P4R6_ARAVE|nr:hypothetical protein AVEN_213727-1 [Araneus ventricosus]
MMKREEGQRFVVGETISSPDKSSKLNISATPRRAGSKVFLSWNSGRKKGRSFSDSKRFDSESRFEIEFSCSRILKAALSLRRCSCSGLVP